MPEIGTKTSPKMHIRRVFVQMLGPPGLTDGEMIDWYVGEGAQAGAPRTVC
ncbi:hypothetical protein Pa4123_92440 [Phytohabitans aurantiacus]|uniref:Uncharacterized protein n=1 Tax=Phytohabitans aurantiacus TaxID=3016789 RepID=A0ABQ5RCK9_9ACTN|nr:hypothetical protein Pa4123_92440 [Phytohabitans aurantiacus]